MKRMGFCFVCTNEISSCGMSHITGRIGPVTPVSCAPPHALPVPDSRSRGVEDGTGKSRGERRRHEIGPDSTGRGEWPGVPIPLRFRPPSRLADCQSVTRGWGPYFSSPAAIQELPRPDVLVGARCARRSSCAESSASRCRECPPGGRYDAWGPAQLLNCAPHGQTMGGRPQFGPNTARITPTSTAQRS